MLRATICSPIMPRSPSNAGAPVPSIIRAARITRSYIKPLFARVDALEDCDLSLSIYISVGRMTDRAISNYTIQRRDAIKRKEALHLGARLGGATVATFGDHLPQGWPRFEIAKMREEHLSCIIRCTLIPGMFRMKHHKHFVPLCVIDRGRHGEPCCVLSYWQAPTAA